MKQASKVVIIAAVLSSVACAHVSQSKVEGLDPASYRLLVHDDIERRRFNLELAATGAKSICLTLSQWPGKTGWVDGGGQIAKMISGADVYPARDRSFGYSAGQVYVIAPRETLKAFIPYSEFGDAETIARLHTRRLDYLLEPWACSRLDVKNPLAIRASR